VNKYGIPVADLPAHCLDAVDAAERSLSRTLIVRDGHAIAAIVPMTDLDRIDPPDPAVNGTDPLVALAGTCQHDDFVSSLDMPFVPAPGLPQGADDLSVTTAFHRK
jgi:hypothetical protein